MVGHDDLGYTDIGEEVDWVDWDAKEAEAKAKAGKKGKKAGGASKGSKIVSAEPVAGAALSPEAKTQLHKQLRQLDFDIAGAIVVATFC